MINSLYFSKVSAAGATPDSKPEENNSFPAQEGGEADLDENSKIFSNI